MDRLGKKLQKEKDKDNKVIKYYHYKDMDIKTPYWFLFPVLVVMYWAARFCAKVERFRRKRLNKWNDKRTERILKYAFPKVCSVCTLNDSFYFTCRDNAYLLRWSQWSRPWDWYYCDLHNLEILNYLAWDFEIPGYVKTVREEDDYPDNWITVTFKKESIK